MSRRGAADAKLADVTPTPIAVLATILLTACATSGGDSVGSGPASTSVPGSPAATTTTGSSATRSVEWVGPCGRAETAPSLHDHVIWIWMENKDRGDVFDATTTPFMHTLAASCGSASNYVDHGIRPSLPNYIAATSGGTQGISDDKFLTNTR